jgi:hypothetical protein
MVKIGGCELIAHLLCVAGVACFVVAQVTYKWTDTGTAYSGLWKQCVVVNSVETCNDISFDFTTNLFLSVTKCILLGGAGFIALALLLGGCGLCKDSRSGLVAAEGGLFITASIGIGVATGIYLLLDWAGSVYSSLTNITAASLASSNTLSINLSNYGYSFWISWACCACLLIGGIWMCCASCQIKKQKSTIVPVAIPPQAPQPQQGAVQVQIVPGGQVPPQAGYF